MMKRKTIRFKLFMTCLAVFLVPLCVLGVAGGKWAGDTVLKNTEESYAVTLSNVAGRLHSDISGLSDLTTLFAQDPLINRVTYMQGNAIDYRRTGAIALHDFRKTLIFQSTNSGLYSYSAVCFPQKNAVISSLGLWQLDWFLEDEFNVSSMDHNAWMDLFSDGKADHFIHGTSLKTFGYSKNGLAYVQTAVRDSGGDALMAVIFWIDSTKLDAYLSNLALFPGTAAVLRNEGGEIIHVYAENEDMEREVKAMDILSPNTAQTEILGETYTIMRYTRPETGWEYTVFLPKAEVFAQVSQLYRLLIVIIAAMLVLGCLLSFELAHINYRPLARVFHMLSRSADIEYDRRKNETDQIENMLLHLISKEQSLQSQIAANKTMLQYAALSHMLEGDAPSQQLIDSHTLGLLGLPMPHGCFHVGLLMKGNPEDMLNSLRSMPPEQLILYTIRRTGALVCVINHRLQDIRMLFEGLPHAGRGLCLSASHMSASELPLALKEAETALKLAPRDLCSSFFYEDIEQYDQSVTISSQMEQQLIGAVREGDAARALCIFDRHLGKSLNNINAEAAKKYSWAIEITMLKTDNNKGNLKNALSAIPHPPKDNADGLLAYARELLSLSAAYHREQEARRKNDFTAKLVIYISEHICDPDLSLSAVAEEFSVTPTFLSRYFKEKMSIGYLDYVNQNRIRIAKELLMNKNMQIKDVSRASGFLSESTFRRLYKKYEGIAPSRAKVSGATNA